MDHKETNIEPERAIMKMTNISVDPLTKEQFERWENQAQLKSRGVLMDRLIVFAENKGFDPSERQYRKGKGGK